MDLYSQGLDVDIFGFSKFDLICWGCPAGSNPSSPFEETKSQLQASGKSGGWKDEWYHVSP